MTDVLIFSAKKKKVMLFRFTCNVKYSQLSTVIVSF